MRSGAAIAGSAAREVTKRSEQQASAFEDLTPRLVSALTLIPAALAAALAGGPWLAGAAGAAVVAMTYEYARMSEPQSWRPAFGLALAGALGAVMAQSWDRGDLGLSWLAACALISTFRRRSPTAWMETFLGALYVGLPPMLFLALRADPRGLQIVVALFLLIWSADIAAYFGGRLVGGPKLWPWLSPSKTWAGTAAGLAGGAAAGALCAGLFHGPHLWWMVAGILSALVGLGGDLLESAIKRRFGVKDASQLIPGHGGMLDRLDGLIAATVAGYLVLKVSPDWISSLIGGGP
jgi:phosphatidate cytidylyltransferase